MEYALLLGELRVEMWLNQIFAGIQDPHDLTKESSHPNYKYRPRLRSCTRFQTGSINRVINTRYYLNHPNPVSVQERRCSSSIHGYFRPGVWWLPLHSEEPCVRRVAGGSIAIGGLVGKVAWRSIASSD